MRVIEIHPLRTAIKFAEHFGIYVTVTEQIKSPYNLWNDQLNDQQIEY